jgi:hypothetical protein
MYMYTVLSVILNTNIQHEKCIYLNGDNNNNNNSFHLKLRKSEVK